MDARRTGWRSRRYSQGYSAILGRSGAPIVMEPSWVILGLCRHRRETGSGEIAELRGEAESVGRVIAAPAGDDLRTTEGRDRKKEAPLVRVRDGAPPSVDRGRSPPRRHG